MYSRLFSLGFVVGLVGCETTTSSSAEPSDGGVSLDASVPGDAGTPSDASTSIEAGTPGDASTPIEAGTPGDASTPVEAGTPSDASTPVEAGTPDDASAPVEAGTPPDVCATGNGGCDPNATCTATDSGMASCACNAGFTGDGTSCAPACVPVDADPMLPAGKAIVFTVTNVATGAITVFPITDPPNQQTQWNAARNDAQYDASAFVDPASCQGGTLSFYWNIQSGGEQITDVGTTGYHKPTLAFTENSVVGGPLGIYLTVTSSVSGRSSFYHFPVRVTESLLTIDMYNSCQGDTMACDTCDCTIAAALLATEPT